ncbi:MAG: lectin like domain-containing protein [Kiritimatiellaeota bacterium]|nr:lectin like domain-containing protein [Kiritimatiellota bacterium]
MKKQSLLTVGFVVFAMAINSATLVWALEMAPLNPEFQQYQAQQQTKALATRTADGHGLGHIPAPFKLPQPAVSLPAQQGKLQTLPATYDLRDYSKVSSVKDQGDYGNCWAFATFGSMESCLLTAETWDFSENNLANKHGLDKAYGAGGNYYMSLAYLGRWAGPVLETADPYSNGSSSPSGLAVQKHIQSAQFIPDRTSATDNDKIKQAIMTYGGLYSAFYYADAYYNGANYAYYCSSASSGNHAITIVGWDDNFSRTKFNSTPAGDGAFLIKNSWGPSWGNAGYFWISYYDARIGKDNCLFLNAESTANYTSYYQYDPLGFCTALGLGSTTAWSANIFSEASGTIQAVSFYAPAAGASYEVRVYTGVTAGSPTSGTLSSTKTGTLTYAGYYTVVLDSSVSYSTRFSVVLKLTTPGYNYPIPIEYPISGYSSAATASAGESYYSSNGSSWQEAYYSGKYFNCCIKAFGTGGTEPAPVTSEGAPVLTDYDGDYFADPGILRNDGSWHLLMSSWGYIGFTTTAVGSQYIIQPGDFDGDRYSDMNIYDTSSGYWYFMSSRNNYDWYYIGPWGNGYTTSACGDFDGDRRADPMAYENSSGNWYILMSRYGWTRYYEIDNWGGSGYSPLCDDFDGDRYGDLMIYDTASGYWYILASRYNWTRYYYLWFGLAGYTPVTGDLDGDRYADLAIYNKTTGVWYILLSCYDWDIDYVISVTWDGSPS